jgi:hypothetical protein
MLFRREVTLRLEAPALGLEVDMLFAVASTRSVATKPRFLEVTVRGRGTTRV